MMSFDVNARTSIPEHKYQIWRRRRRLYVWSDLLQDDCMWKRKNNLYKSWNDI